MSWRLYTSKTLDWQTLTDPVGNPGESYFASLSSCAPAAYLGNFVYSLYEGHDLVTFEVNGQTVITSLEADGAHMACLHDHCSCTTPTELTGF